ncbi:MAG: 23S rRNA (uracil(1939)-C(5))-methyltransferase RlmD [Solobacterium sp.]|nr:23S rRNA (uracil(1939)-C(5))-methyltransferase RlmD [Solobacterium sp.]
MKCPVQKQCGGCEFIGTSYPETLHRKRKQVMRLYPDHPVEMVLGMEDPYHYRHKIYASFRRNKDGHLIAGLYEEGTHRLVSTENCLIQNETGNRIIRDFTEIADQLHLTAYHEDTGTGILRHLYLRISHADGSVLMVIVTGTRELPGSKKLISMLRKIHPEITSICHSQNHRRTSMVLGDRDRVLYGPGCIHDSILNISFRISSRSFFQVNPVQTEVLYQTALALADLSDTDEVLDLFCGIGTISLLAARLAKHVTGVEIVPQAIRDAIQNAKENAIRNVSFICADAEQYLSSRHIRPDVVITDPPRSGMGVKASHAVASFQAERIVYVSCNPETQKEDCKVLESHGYRIQKIVPVDMFCFTRSIETVVCLSNKNAKPRDYVEIGVDAEDYYRIKDSENKKGK